MVYNECFQNGCVSNRETKMHTKYYAKLHKILEKVLIGRGIFPPLTNINISHFL